MTEITDINWVALSDKALMETIGNFIRHHRLQQNKTQDKLAKEAGIVRSTLSLFEKGENTSMVVFIQLLRSLNLLYMLKAFQVSQQISPLQLVKLSKSERKRAKTIKNKDTKAKSNW